MWHVLRQDESRTLRRSTSCDRSSIAPDRTVGELNPFVLQTGSRVACPTLLQFAWAPG